MPTYQARCIRCCREYEYTSSIANCMTPPICPDNLCRGWGQKVILTAPRGFVTGKFEPFVSPVDGSVITCQRELREHNSRNGVVNIHDGYSEEAIMADGFGSKKVDKQKEVKELANDVGESIQMLNAGYKPTILECEDNG